jgi:predicted PurR-regulated permease PerM
MDIGVRDEKVRLAIEIAIKLGLIFLVILISFLIVKPFIPLLVWAVIIAVALSPVVDKIVKRVKKRKSVIVAITTMIIVSVAAPTYILSDKLIASTTHAIEIIKDGNVTIPQPTQKVKEWPLIGDKAYEVWDSASKNLQNTVEPFKDDIKSMALSIASAIGSGFSTILMFVISMIIASIFLINSKSSVEFYQKFLRRLLGDSKGVEWANLSALTVRSVAVGVLGVAVIQSAFALLGLVVMDIPFAPIFAFAIMFLTIIQLPALIIIAPIIAYVFSYADGTSASIFAIYMLIVGASDGVLKPLLMGRGVDIPMLVILIGAIGGMMLMGMVGLFVGAVIFALSYKLFGLWIDAISFESSQKQ